MEKILKALDGHVRVNTANNTVEIFNEYGVRMRLVVDEATLKEFKDRYQSF